jgi:hypothetical protein
VECLTTISPSRIPKEGLRIFRARQPVCRGRIPRALRFRKSKEGLGIFRHSRISKEGLGFFREHGPARRARSRCTVRIPEKSTEHRAQSTEHRAQSTEHRAQSTEHRAQSTDGSRIGDLDLRKKKIRELENSLLTDFLLTVLFSNHDESNAKRRSNRNRSPGA